MDLFAWGANSHGQLGVGSFTEFELPQIVESAPKNISKIFAGGGHTLAITSNGESWATGWNKKGQLGLGSTSDVNEFQKLKFEHKFDSIFAGWDTSAGITVDNRIFVWGSNAHNQLGYSSDDYKVITRPVELKLPNHERAATVVFGLRHTAVLTIDNQIYIMGSLKHFRSTKHKIIHHNSTEFMLITPQRWINHIASGQNHIVFSDNQETIHSIGENKYMESEIQSDRKIVQLSSGWTHTAFVTEAKELYLFGRNDYGQLGNGTRFDSTELQKCPIYPVDKFQLGAEHGILLSLNEAFSWGWNEHGNCGNGSMEDVLKPTKLDFMDHMEKVFIVAGSGFCMVLCKS